MGEVRPRQGLRARSLAAREVREREIVIAAILIWLACCISHTLAQTGNGSGRNENAGAATPAIAAVMDDRHVSDSAFAVHRRAMSLNAENRYQFLMEWVLPSHSHNSFRIGCDFTPTHPAPPSAEHHPHDAARLEIAKQRGEARVQIGGELVSPALDLIAIARELKKLDELHKKVDGHSAGSQQQQAAKLSLLAMIAMASERFDEALRNLDALYPLIEANDKFTLPDRSAELLAIHSANRHPRTRDFARDAAANLYGRGIRVPNHGPAAAWESQLMTIMAATRLYDRHGENAPKVVAEMGLSPQLAEWSPANRTTAGTRGAGHSRAHWQRAGERIENANSHHDDYLYYHIPLQGDYQVECDLQCRDYQNTELVVGGHWVEPLYYSRNRFDFGSLRERLGRGTIEPFLTKFNDTIHMRALVRGSTVTYYVNGRPMHQVEARGELDPWVILRSEDRYDGAAADIRITGNPTIPRELRLTASEDLTGWFAYFPAEVGKPKATWQQLGDLPAGGGIIAPGRVDLAGMHVERLLQYHRPMLEDGAIEYDFYYRDGEIHVHPALDRLAFLLEPEGVRIHWVTDGARDRTDLTAANVFDEPAQRRGPEKLPLVDDAWNRLRLTLENDTVLLHLNEQLVYQRELEVTNQRSFGLFHYSDRSEARVRNVRWRGAWPAELPATTKQELASHRIQPLDDRLPELPAVFEHNFATGGLPTEKFSTIPSTQEGFEQNAEGVRVLRRGLKGYHASSIVLNATVAGDFDLLADFQEFHGTPEPGSYSTAGIKLYMSPVNPQQCLLMRRFIREIKQEDKQVAQAVLRNGATEATLDWKTIYSDAQESDSGKLRIARRGDRIYYLIAEADSLNFRLLGEAKAESGSLAPKGIHLTAQTFGLGDMVVTWKNISLRAEQIAWVPAGNVPQQRSMTVMNLDGTQLRRLLPKDSGLDGPGSPSWSPDGKQVAFDVYNGSTSNSRMYLLDADGNQLRDLGIGNMPTFSPDGKRIAFSWGPKGITVMNADGTNREVLDRNGWGAQWSPDGRIAYARGGNVVVYDLKTRQQRMILEGEQASRYANVYWNLGWSCDGKRICFKGRTANGNQYEIAVVAAAGSGQEFQVLYQSPQEMVADFTWHPDGNRIFFCMQMGGGPRLFMLDRSKPGKPILLSGQPLNHYITGVDLSRDGKQFVFSSQVLSE